MPTSLRDLKKDQSASETKAHPPEKSKAHPTGTLLKHQILRNVDHLPSMPQVIFKAQEIIENPEAGVQELSKIIETDQAVVTKMLKLANSAYYGLSGKVSTVKKAITLLGIQTLKELLITVGYAKLLDQKLDGYGYSSGDLWRHAIAVGLGSKIIAAKRRIGDAGEAYMAGLIHDAGKLILDPYIMERRQDFTRIMEEESQTFLNAERIVLGFDHADIAFQVCRKWRVPDTISRAVQYHHAPSQSDGDRLSYIVHMADCIAKSAGLGYGRDDHLYVPEEGAVDNLGLTQAAIAEIASEVITAMLAFQD